MAVQMPIDAENRRQAVMLRPGQCADALSVHPRKVWEWIAAGRLKAENVTPGGKRPTWRIDPRDFQRFRDGLRNEPKGQEAKAARRAATSDEVIRFF